MCVLTRNAAIPVLHAITCAPITRTIRSIASEVPVGPDEGLPDHGVITCDNVMTIPMSALDPEPIGSLALPQRMELDRAIRYSLDLVF